MMGARSRRAFVRRSERGFALLEILVAFLILALGLGAISTGVVVAMRSDARTQVNRTALRVAQSRLEAAGISEALAPGYREGLVANKFRWRQTVTEVRPASDTRPPQGAMADKIRQALDAPIKGHEFKEVALQDVIAFYRDLSNQVPFVAALGSFAEKPVTLHLTKELPLGAHLQALQDAAPFLTVFVRDYGLFFTVDNSPPDGVSYLDFWHGKSKSDGKKP